MRILVTGTSTGLGRATAEVLTKEGHEVIATARNLDSIADLEVFQKLPLDVCSDESVAACAEAAGDIDVLVNNAGVSETGPLELFPIEVLTRMLDTNAVGPLRMIQAFTPGMRKRGHGIIVNVTSVQGQVATPLSGAYCASKHALEAISETLALELGHFGIRVVIVQPGYIAPGMRHGGRHGEAEPPYDELRRQWDGVDSTLVGPEGRPGPEIVGEAIAKAIADEDSPLRIPVGKDGEMVLATRKALSDPDFHQAMRDLLNLTW